MSKVRFIGLDVHADTIAVAAAEPGGDVRSLGVIPNRPESIRKLVKKLGLVEELWGSLYHQAAQGEPASGTNNAREHSAADVGRLCSPTGRTRPTPDRPAARVGNFRPILNGTGIDGSAE